ncbi:B12-binding domain-containing radical SAM protein [Alkalibacter rhizosphaerae]|uniref:B12-binding domain-containing radical SAM protein n=1 Tax=Alkalibacter rhizosphaerae TaxID=2815577 RepID=A0A974XE84_9FIRM|nr:B12-binding domain-containing radical SAM protein [Alkalibacter rhizosphaerae]QSX08126.1 B12-binding domain-containing radical SAM protein [Alkalibacter rhizosphaerae]
MMKVVLASLNTKYVHTNVAIRSLKTNCHIDGISVQLREFTINDREEHILGRLVEEKAQVYAFSIYIWNLEPTRRIMGNLKKIRPDAWIVVGGPEVSYLTESEAWELGADLVISGEGEKIFPRVMEAISKGESLEEFAGVSYNKGNKSIRVLTSMEPVVLDELSFPYTKQELNQLKDNILYYESSRGCPYSCAYCMSSVEKGLRNKSMTKVKEELTTFLEAGVKLVKLVDRTFNCNKERAKEILTFLLDQEGETCFHFEVAADLLDEELLELLGRTPVGRFQLEAGVQSVHPETLKRIARVSNIPQVKENMNRILQKENVHVHMDLIAGLPGEGLEQIARSFNEIMDVGPHMLQLGFLKILKGSPMENMVESFGYKFQGHPPYQVLKNNSISYEELWLLHLVEHVLEKYYNSGNFPTTLEMVRNSEEQTPFDFYCGLAAHWDKKGFFDRKISKDALYQILFDYLCQNGFHRPMVEQTLKMDYLLQASWPLPPFLHPTPLPKEKAFALLHSQGFVEEYLKDYMGKPPKDIVKQVYFEIFDGGRGNKRLGLFSPKKTGLFHRNMVRWVEDWSSRLDLMLNN